MTHPGNRLRSLASRILSAESMTRVVDPAVADLQSEYAMAVGRRAALVLVRGWASIIAALVAQGTLDLWRNCGARSADDRKTAARVIIASLILLLITTSLFARHPILRLTERLPFGLDRLALMLLPQALVVSLPIALTLGMAFGLRTRRVTAPVVTIVLFLSLLSTAVSFSTMGWVVPVANQAFRVGVAGRDVPRGHAELSLGELRERVQRLEYLALQDVRTQYAYQMRFALPLAPLALVLVAVCVMPRSTRTAVRVTVAAIACSAYYALLERGQAMLVGGPDLSSLLGPALDMSLAQ